MILVVTSTLSCPEAKGDPPTHLQIRQALSVAHLTIKEGLADVSMQAVRKCLANGPPTDQIKEKFQLELRSARVDTTRYANLKDVSVEQEILSELRQLTSQWQDAKVSQDEIIQTLNSVLMPSGRQSEVFLYAVVTDHGSQFSNRLPKATSLIHLVLDRTDNADLLMEIETNANRRLPAAGINGHVVLAMIALNNRDEQELSSNLNSITELLNSATPETTLVLSAEIARDAICSGLAQSSAADILTSTSTLMSRRETASTQRTQAQPILLEAGRAQLQTGDLDQALSVLRRYLESDSGFLHSSNSHNGYLNRRRMTVAKELLSRGLTEEYQSLLGEHAPEFERNFQQIIGEESLQKNRDTLAANDDTPRVSISRYDMTTGEEQFLHWLPGLSSAKAPQLSSDGSTLALQGTLKNSATASEQRIFTVSINDGALFDLGPGASPSWSPRNHRLAVSRFTPQRGLWIVSHVDSNVELVDELSWGGVWSHDGRKIAGVRQTPDGYQLCVHDLVEQTVKLFILPVELRRTRTSPSLLWLSGSDSLIAIGQPAGKIQGLDLNSSAWEKSSFPELPKISSTPVAYHPASRKLAGVRSEPGKYDRLTFYSANQTEWTLEKSIPLPDRELTGMCWTPDGRSLILVTRKKPN